MKSQSRILLASGCFALAGMISIVAVDAVLLIRRAVQPKPQLVNGRYVSEWLGLASSADARTHSEAVGALSEALSSALRRGPMNCAGPDPSIWFEQLRIAQFRDEVRSCLPRIIGILEQAAAGPDANDRAKALEGLSYLSRWTDRTEFERLLPMLIAACQDEGSDVRRAARKCVINNLDFGYRGYDDYRGLPINELIPILTAPDLSPDQRYSAVVSLGMIGPDAVEAVPWLEQIIKEIEQKPDGTCVVQQANWAIKRIRTPDDEAGN